MSTRRTSGFVLYPYKGTMLVVRDVDPAPETWLLSARAAGGPAEGREKEKRKQKRGWSWSQ